MLPYGRRAGRTISVSAVPVGPGIDIWRSCRFFGSIFPFLDWLPGGLRKFVPCRIGWENAGMDLLLARVRHLSLVSLTRCCRFLVAPGGSNALLLAGGLPLRCCIDRFAQREPCWNLPEHGRIHSKLAPGGEEVGLVEVAPVTANMGGLLD